MLTSVQGALSQVLAGDLPPPAADFAGFWAADSALREVHPDPLARAVVLAASSDRLAFAFSAGFRAALVSLQPERDPRGELKLAFCATEDQGVHPRAIQTALTLEGDMLRLRGHKRWATLGVEAEELWVVCRAGQTAEGRPELAVVRVGVGAPGVLRGEPISTPFCPELSHTSFSFDTLVSLEQRFPGDGYADFLKPFRSAEDAHVQLVLTAYLLGVVQRHALDVAWRERLTAQLLGLWLLCRLDFRAVTTHFALSGAIAQGQQLLAEFEPCWEHVGADERGRWQRDVPLLAVAGKARSQRQEVARAALRSNGA